LHNFSYLDTVGEVKVKQLPTIDELPDKFVTLPDGIRVRYLEYGPADGFPLLLTHGFLGSVRDWRYNIVALAGDKRRVIALDWVGFGHSDKPALKYSLFYFADFLHDFAQALHLQRFDLAGHSMGGKHNLAFAILYPDYVNKLALIDTDGFIIDPLWTKYTTTFFRPMSVLLTEFLGNPKVLKSSLKNVFYDRSFYPADSEIEANAIELRDPVFKKSLLSLNANYPQLSMRLTKLYERVGEIKVPIQLFWGWQDKIIPVANAHLAHSLLPTSDLYIFDRCGHLPQAEHAAVFNRLLTEFLEAS